MKKISRILLVVLAIAALAFSALGAQNAFADPPDCAGQPGGCGSQNEFPEVPGCEQGNGEQNEHNPHCVPTDEPTDEPTDTPTDVPTDEPTVTSTPSPTPIVTSTPSPEQEEEKVKEDKPAPAAAAPCNTCCNSHITIDIMDMPGFDYGVEYTFAINQEPWRVIVYDMATSDLDLTDAELSNCFCGPDIAVHPEVGQTLTVVIIEANGDKHVSEVSMIRAVDN